MMYPNRQQGYPMNSGQYGAPSSSNQYQAQDANHGHYRPQMPFNGPSAMHQNPVHVYGPNSSAPPMHLMAHQQSFLPASTISSLMPLPVATFPQATAFLPNAQPVSPGRARHSSGGHPNPNVQQQGLNQGQFYTPGPFSPPQQHHASNVHMNSRSQNPSIPPPLFRPGPHTPNPKPATMRDDKQLNKAEKDKIYRTFGVILQQFGPLEVTDKRLLSAFMSMTPYMRQGIKYLGGLKEFFRQGSVFKIEEDVVSLVWQDEEDNGKEQTFTKEAEKKQDPPKATSLLGQAPSSKRLPSDKKETQKAVQKSTPKPDISKEDSEEDGDDEWEGEEEEKPGWWLLDPLPGEEEDWKQVSPLQGRMGGGYFDDFRKLEQKENKDPEEIKTKLFLTSTPAFGSNVTSPREEKTQQSPKEKEETAPVSLSWEESTIAQEEAYNLSRERGDQPTDTNSGQDFELESTERANLAKLSFTGMGKPDGDSAEDAGEVDAVVESVDEAMESVDEGGEPVDRRELVNRSGSLHQAEDDVILVEVVEEDSTGEDEDARSEAEDAGKDDRAVDDVIVIEDGDVPDEAVDDVIVCEDGDVPDEAVDDVIIGEDGDVPNEAVEDDIIVENGNAPEEEVSTSRTDLSRISKEPSLPEPEDEKEEHTGDPRDDVSDAISPVSADRNSPVKLEEEQTVSCAGEEPPPEREQNDSPLAKSLVKQETDMKEPTEITTNQGPEGLERHASETKDEKPAVSVRSIGMVTTKPQLMHKAMCTKEIKTRSCKVNTLVLPVINRCTETGEDPRIEAIKTRLARETQKNHVLSEDVEDLRDKLVLQKNQHAIESKSVKHRLDQVSKELTEAERKLRGRATVENSELRKTTVELKDTESRLTAAKSKIARAEKENSNLTRELEKTTRQLLDLERSQAQEPDVRDSSTCTEGLEPEKDPAVEKENGLLKMRSRLAEQKVVELKYQYAMQSLNQALQESQYIFRMYGNTLLSSSHRECLRMKWMDYQMYIKEMTDEVAKTYYSALKALQQDVPLTDIPSLGAKHVETFNPYKSPVKSQDMQYLGGESNVPLAQTFPTPDVSADPTGQTAAAFASFAAPQIPAAGTSQFDQGAIKQPPPGIPTPTDQAKGQRPPGLSNVQVSGGDISMPFMQAQTQRAAPGKVMRRVPRKTPKAFLAANFMSSLQHTTKVYGAKEPTTATIPGTLHHTTKVYGAKEQPATATTAGIPGSLQQGSLTGKKNLANVHDWLKTMDTDVSRASRQASAIPSDVKSQKFPPGLSGFQSSSTVAEPSTWTVDEAVSTQPSLPAEILMAPSSNVSRPAGIGRGRPVSARGTPSPQPLFPTPQPEKREDDVAMTTGMKRRASPRGPPDIAANLSGASSKASSRTPSPFPLDARQPVVKTATSPPLSTSQRGSPAGAASEPAVPLEKPMTFRGDARPVSPAAKMRPASAGDAASSRGLNQLDSFKSTAPVAKARSVSVGGASRTQNPPAKVSKSPTVTKPTALQPLSGNKVTPAHILEESAPAQFHYGGDTSKVPPRLRARQMRMPYHRVPEGVGSQEQGTSAGGGEISGWTTQVSKRKRKAMNLAEQQTQLMKEYRSLTGVHDAVRPDGLSAKGRGQSKKQGSLDKLINYLAKQYKHMTRKEMTDAILQVRLDHNGSLSGIPMGTIISEASGYLTRSQQKKQRKPSDKNSPLCAVCRDELEGRPSERNLECGHTFHNECIKVWVNEEGTCPICRKHTLFAEDFPRLS